MGLFRPKRLNKLSALIVAIPLGVYTILAVGWTLRGHIIDRDFALSRVDHVVGYIDSLQISHYRGSTRRQFYCHYSANEMRRDAHYSADFEDGRDLQEGGTIPIKFLHEWPEVSRIDLPWADAERARDAWAMLFIPFLLAAMSGYGFWQYRSGCREKRPWW